MTGEEMIQKVVGEDATVLLLNCIRQQHEGDDVRLGVNTYMAVVPETGKGQMFAVYMLWVNGVQRAEEVFACAHGEGEEERLEALKEMVRL